MAHSDYSKQILPYGAGSTRGMTKRNYEAIAGAIRDVCESDGMDVYGITMIPAWLLVNMLASRLASGNDRFDRAAFINAATNAARKES